MRVRAPSSGQGSNVFTAWLKARGFSETEAMTWLHRTHPDLVRGVVLATELDQEAAARVLAIVKAAVRR